MTTRTQDAAYAVGVDVGSRGMRESSCPGRASAVAVGMTLEGHDLVPAGRPGALHPYPAA